MLSDLTQPTTLTLRAIANEPELVVFNAEVFTARLHGVGTLDVIGPVCPLDYSFVRAQECAADPAIMPIGVTYADLTGPKPTGPAFPWTDIRLVLVTGDLRAGTYHLVEESGQWRRVSEDTSALRPLKIDINFSVTGPNWPLREATPNPNLPI